MGHKHSKEEILAGALDTAFVDGLSQLTFGRVARHLGISDRIVVYYFPTKDDLVTEVLLAVAVRLQATLAPMFAAPAADHMDLVRRAWPALARPSADPVFALFFEANGLAAAQREPYRDVVPQLVESWLAWSAELLQGTPAQRRVEAEAAIALIDGLLLLRQLGGAAPANRAAKRLGVT
jgi:AcrR family transcriptional regulator